MADSKVNALVCDQMQTALALTLAGAGIALIAEAALRLSAPGPAAWCGGDRSPCFYAFRPDLSRRMLYLAARRDGYESFAAREFRQMLQADLAPAGTV